MRVVIVTGDSPHHKHLCVRLVERHNIVGIIHPVVRSGMSKVRRLRNWARLQGWPLALLSGAAALPTGLSGWNMSRELAKAGQRYYGRFLSEYEKIDPALIHRAVDVRSVDARELISRLDADVVVTLGGPVYPRALIDSCRLMLNFHSGLSPVYNGSSTINFAFANGHPHLCGGTLMQMSSVIDGGAILGHYLPSIEADDSPVSLFMKTVGGAASLYERFLDGYSAGPRLNSIPQTPPLFYYRHMNWSVYHTQLVLHHLKTGLARRYLRSEQVVEYWSAATEDDARKLFRCTMDALLFGAVLA